MGNLVFEVSWDEEAEVWYTSETSIQGAMAEAPQTAVRHSRRLEITVEEELRLLLVHAVLHLLGFDHKKKKEREIMREKEKEVLSYLAETGA